MNISRRELKAIKTLFETILDDNTYPSCTKRKESLSLSLL